MTITPVLTRLLVVALALAAAASVSLYVPTDGTGAVSPPCGARPAAHGPQCAP